ncbi:MAG: hypothetical protein U0670_01755 [Anaerolineae bacterium]
MTARSHCLKGRDGESGDIVSLHVELDRPIALEKGTRFAISEHS